VAVAGLMALSTVPAGAATVSARPAVSVRPHPATNMTVPGATGANCTPARRMTGKERAALPKDVGMIRCKVPLPAPAHPRLWDAATLAQAADPPVDSKFSFCNTTGGTIACFIGLLHYVSATEFTLSDVELSDDLCDSRSVYADVYSQASFFGEFFDSNGCDTTVDVPGPTDLSDPIFGVQYVYIDLYACNLLSCSSDAYSLEHDNPFSG
jgi:hypothetical protein